MFSLIEEVEKFAHIKRNVFVVVLVVVSFFISFDFYFRIVTLT